MRKQLPLLRASNKGSAIVGTLVMIGILALAVGSMLHNANYTTRASRDKIMYEEAYQAAISGTHVARAWLIDPELAKSMTNDSTMATKLQNLTDAAQQMGTEIIDTAYVAANKTPSQMQSTWFSSFGSSALPDGRIVLYEFPKNASSAIAVLKQDRKNPKFNDTLFKSSNSDKSNYVDSVRITTLGTTPEASGNLRTTTFIIESKGVSEYAGAKKERTVQQRVLVYPQQSSQPLLGADEAIITAGGFTGQGHNNVHWAPAIAKGDIELLGIELQAPKNKNGKWLLDVGMTGDKFNVGGKNVNDPHFTVTQLDKWVKWMAGTGSELILNNNKGAVFQGITNKPVNDFFKQLFNNEFAGTIVNEVPLTLANITFSGYADTFDKTIASGGALGIFDVVDGQISQGTFVQDNSNVNQRVDDFFTRDANYADLKDIAVQENRYIRPKTSNDTGTSNFVDYNGNTLYYVGSTGELVQDPGPGRSILNSINNLSMKTRTDADTANQTTNGYNVHSKTAVRDELLFVDHPDQNPNKTSSFSLGSSFFWKGLMYVCGDVNAAGSGSAASILAKNPDQYTASPFGSNTGTKLDKVIMDGILVVTGIFEGGGNATIYGTVATLGGVGTGGTPSVYYNSANKNGRMQKPTDQPADFRLLGGRLYESDNWAT